MVNKELLDYIKSVREKGFSDDAIKSHLIKHGYTNEAAEQAFSELSSGKMPGSQASPPWPSSQAIPKKQERDLKKKRFPFAIAAIALAAFVLIGAGAYVYLSGLLPFFNSCSDVLIAIHSINGESMLCAYPDLSKVQMFIKNDGKATITKAEIAISGEKGRLKDMLSNLNLMPGDVYPRLINYSGVDYGMISSVEITPIISENNIDMSCSSKKIKIASIKNC